MQLLYLIIKLTYYKLFQAAYASNPAITGNGAFLVAGGSGPGSNSIEYLTSSGWKLSSTKLPSASIYGCAAPVNSSHYIILEGKNGNDTESNRTFFFNPSTEELTPGPQRLVARAGFSCATTRFGSGSTVVVVAGGRSGSTCHKSVEFLDLSIGSWSAAAGKCLIIF